MPHRFHPAGARQVVTNEYVTTSDEARTNRTLHTLTLQIPQSERRNLAADGWTWSLSVRRREAASQRLVVLIPRFGLVHDLRDTLEVSIVVFDARPMMARTRRDE